MKLIHVVAGVSLSVAVGMVAVMAWLTVRQVMPLRQTVTVTTYDTVQVLMPVGRSGEPLTLCSPQVRRAVEPLAEHSQWHDLPELIASACGAMGQGLR